MKNIKEESLKSLCKQKKYEEVYSRFGGKVYRRHTPLTYQISDVKRLLEEERYYALYEKYGNAIYSMLMPYIKRRDIVNELGYDPIDARIEQLQDDLKDLATLICAIVLTLNTTADILLIAGLNATNDDEYKDDEELIEVLADYDESINSYADYINSLGLDDLETIVKVMSDMWDNIYGYNANVDGYSNEMDYLRLALYTYGYGVCRHMADDFTARMNAINPEYKAYNMTVYLSDSYDTSDIERFAFSDDPAGEEDLSFPEPVIDFLKSKAGNHMVTCLTIPGTNTKLIVDATNPAIGVLRNGIITMLTDQNDARLTPMHVSNLGYKWKNKSELSTYLGDCLKSYFIPYDVADLREKYGTEAQNEALSRVAKYDSSEYKVNPINTDNEDETKGKSPLYYDGYTIESKDDSIYFKMLSSDAQPLDEVSYREINHFLQNHSDLKTIYIDYIDGTIDFTKIDFSLLENIDFLRILCCKPQSANREVVINGSVTKLFFTLNPNGNTNIGTITLRPENAKNISINLANEAVSENISIQANYNAESITISSKDKTDFEITEHTGDVKHVYYIDGRVVTEEMSYAKRMQKILP